MEDLSAVPLRAPTRGGRSVTILVANDILGAFEDSPELAKTVVNDIVQRDEYGYKKYGQNLETHDGRPTIWDLYQELLDGVQYMRKLIEEGEMPTSMANVYPTLLELTKITRRAIINQDGAEEATNWSKPDEERDPGDVRKARAVLSEENLVEVPE